MFSPSIGKHCASISGTVTEITQEGVTVSNRMGGGQRGNKGGMKAPEQ